jgi:hypothetical protein
VRNRAERLLTGLCTDWYGGTWRGRVKIIGLTWALFMVLAVMFGRVPA